MIKLILYSLAFTLASTIFSCQILDPSKPGNLVPCTVAEDFSLPAIDINGTRLHFETYGDPANPILIALHGGPGDDYRYMLKLKVFADSGYFVIFFDQRGCGLSKRHDASSITLANYLNDLDIIISRYRKGQQHVYLIGHSWGAMYATMYINSFCSERLKG